MNDERSHLTSAAVALLAETDSSMNSARIKENGASEKTPMQTFINALPLAPPLEPPTGPRRVNGRIMRPGHTKAPDHMLSPKGKSLPSTGASPRETHPIQHLALPFHLPHP
jgi:hypothetical protein